MKQQNRIGICRAFIKIMHPEAINVSIVRIKRKIFKVIETGIRCA
jgi:hypothetical protein